MKLDSSLNIIGYIISLIIAEKFDASINSLSSACNIPIQQMRKCIAIIFQNKILLSHLSDSPESNDDADDADDADDPLTASTLFRDKLASGNYDNANIYLVNMEDFIEDYLLLPVTPVEIGYMNTTYPSLLQNHMTSLFEIKDSIDSIPPYILERQDLIQDAILQNRQVEFMYKSPQHGTSRIQCSPVSVVQNITSHILYLKDTNNFYYRLDRIKSTIKILTIKSEISAYIPDTYQKYFWGTEYQNHGSPIHVKLRITNETSNIIEKIKKDTALRIQTSSFYQDDNFFYYEDDVLGIQDFRRWLRSYGSSITVLEPRELIDEIVSGANRALEYYNLLTNK